MSRRTPNTITLVAIDGAEGVVRASHIESLSWSGDIAVVTMATNDVVRVAMDLPTYNALVADWALSAPGRTTSLRFAIRAHARAGRLTGAETWPRNKP